MLTAPVSESVISIAVLTLASVIQGLVAVSSRKSLSNQLKNGIHDSIKSVERKVDTLGTKVGALEVSVARLDERTKKES